MLLRLRGIALPTLLDPPHSKADIPSLLQVETALDVHYEFHHGFHHGDAHILVKDLHRPNPVIYWTDLLLTSFIGWAAFAVSAVSRPFSLGMIAAAIVSVLAFYRALSFLHEISHQNSRTLPGFEAGWNLLIGYPLLMPSFFYVGVHGDHHKLNTYGTVSDPEYLPFAKSCFMTTMFALNALLVPAILIIRFLLFTPFGLLSPRIAKLLVERASSLTMNLRYRREPTPELIARVQRHSAAIWMLWMNTVLFAACGLLPWRIFLLWLAVDASISFLNALRTLGAHAYESAGEPLDRTGQLLDSIDTPGLFWTELWAPVGLRYHALHHYFPGIPYHNLEEGYRRLIGTLPLARNYKRMTSRSLAHSLQALYRKGIRRVKPGSVAR